MVSPADLPVVDVVALEVRAAVVAVAVGQTDLVTGAPAGGSKSATASSDAIYINGVLCQAEVYKIDGNNYFKLRDLGRSGRLPASRSPRRWWR